MEEAAKVAEVLETQLRCPIKLAHSELAQVNQGAFRAVLAFLSQRVRNVETVRRARASALLKTRSLPLLQLSAKEDLRQALLEREKEKKASKSRRQTSKIAKLRKMALDVFHSKVRRLISQIKLFSVAKPRPEGNSKLEFVTLANYSDMLMSLHSQSNELPAQAIKGLLESSGLSASRALILETLTLATRERVFDFTTVKASIQPSKSAALIVERLRTQLNSAYAREWKEFLHLEGLLDEIKRLQLTFNAIKAAADKSSTYSRNVKALADLRLNVCGLTASRFQMEASLIQLKDYEKELTQQLKMRNSQSERYEAVKAEADYLQTKAVTATEQNAAMRQTISKYKVRVHNFLQRHVLGMKEKLPTLAKPIFSTVVREADAFQGWQPLPGPRGPDTDGLLNEVYLMTSTSPYKDLQEVLQILQTLPDDEAVAPLPPQQQRLPPLALTTSTRELDVSKARDLLQEWQMQGGQFCIPWRKDATGRDIEEWLNMWRPVALQQQFQP